MDIKDMQIDILTKTIASLIRENAEFRSVLMVMQNEKSKQREVQNGDNERISESGN